jgi:hypothetical protein
VLCERRRGLGPAATAMSENAAATAYASAVWRVVVPTQIWPAQGLVKCHNDVGVQWVTGSDQRLQGLGGTLNGVSKCAVRFASSGPRFAQARNLETGSGRGTSAPCGVFAAAEVAPGCLAVNQADASSLHASWLLQVTIAEPAFRRMADLPPRHLASAIRQRAARSRRFLTVVAYHWPPRAVRMP